MEAAVKPLKDLQNEVTCSICRNYLSEPVTIECGHSFCKACVSLIWTVGATIFSCPECRQVSLDREIPSVNRRLAELTELSKQLRSKLLQSIEGQSQCGTHKKLFKLFCEDDESLLCVTCCETTEHGAHKILPAEEAADNCKKKLQLILSRLEKHFQEDEKLLAQEENPTIDWHLMLKGEYFKAQSFLLEEEFHSLGRLNEEEKVIQHRINHHMQTIQNLRLDLQEAGNQLNLDVLQDAKQLLRRSETVLSQRDKVVTLDLREYPIPGMIELLNRFRVELTMDPTSADSCVIISEDLKSVKAAADWEVEDEPPQNSPCHYVFAEQAFSSGSQYWEVDVTQLSQWILGIYSPNLRRRGYRNMEFCSSLFLLRCVKKGEDYYLQTHPGSLNHRVKSPVPRIGVYLEYCPGTLVFYNVLQSSLIYRFYPIVFTEPVAPLFSPGPPLPGTKPGTMTLCPVDSHLCACCSSCV